MDTNNEKEEEEAENAIFVLELLQWLQIILLINRRDIEIEKKQPATANRLENDGIVHGKKQSECHSREYQKKMWCLSTDSIDLCFAHTLIVRTH